MNVTKLENLIEKTYNRRFEILSYMEDQKVMKVNITEIYEDQKEYVENFIAGKPHPVFEEKEVLEALLCDLCTKGKLKAGKRLIEFDD